MRLNYFSLETLGLEKKTTCRIATNHIHCQAQWWKYDDMGDEPKLLI